MTKDNTHPVLNELIHPSQLEQKYGGEAENLTIFWPPRFDSMEFGHDPNMIEDDTPENLSTLQHQHNISEIVDEMSLIPNSSPFCERNEDLLSNKKSKRNKYSKGSMNNGIPQQNIQEVVKVSDIHLDHKQQENGSTDDVPQQKKVGISKNNKGCCCVF